MGQHQRREEQREGHVEAEARRNQGRADRAAGREIDHLEPLGQIVTAR
jgi:hypothetical protein